MKLKTLTTSDDMPALHLEGESELPDRHPIALCFLDPDVVSMTVELVKKTPDGIRPKRQYWRTGPCTSSE